MYTDPFQVYYHRDLHSFTGTGETVVAVVVVVVVVAVAAVDLPILTAVLCCEMVIVFFYL